MDQKIIDVDHLLTMTGGDLDLAEEVLDIFRHQAEIWGRILKVDLPPRQWADAAHTIKGAALSIGAGVLAETCQAAEALGRSEAPGRTESAIILREVRDRLTETLDACSNVTYALSKPA